jgi:hypothetical protein
LPDTNCNLHRDIDHNVISNLQSLAITNLQRLALRRYFLKKLHAHQYTAPNQTCFCDAGTVSEATGADAISFGGPASTSVASCTLTAELPTNIATNKNLSSNFLHLCVLMQNF